MNARQQARRWVVAVAAGTALATGPASVASAHQGGRVPEAASFADQEVVELTTSGTGHASGLAYHQTRAASVTATNAAVAYAACDGCRAVSVSFQVVVADGDPTTLDAGNLAVAMTENCTGCEAVAVAYQLVVTSVDRLRLSGAGHHQLAQVRRELRQLARSELPPLEVQARADELAAAVTATLSDELQTRVRVRSDRDRAERPAAPPPGHDARGDGPATAQQHGLSG